MKELFKPKKFRSASLRVIELAEAICNEYEAQGYDLSLRQLFYQFVSRGFLANTEKNYKRLGGIISDARLAGLLDWDALTDRSRETVKNPHWSSPRDILKSCAEQFQINLWEGQENHVEVMTEKQALEGILVPVCREMDVAFTAYKGYASTSVLFERGQELKRKRPYYHELHVIYLGDHDPSGIDMSRDVHERLELLSGGEVNVDRIALNMDQIEKYQPPADPTKTTDKRAAGYISKFGNSSWEIDALKPEVLVTLVKEKIASLCNQELFNEALRRRDIWRKEIRGLADNVSLTAPKTDAY